MARPKRDLKQLYMNIPTNLNDKVEKYANENCMTKTDAVCKLLRESLEREKETI